MPDAYRVRDPATDEIISNQTDANVTDAVNRFARSANAAFVDRGSDLLDEFVDYSVWDIDIKPVGSDAWERRFSGFVAEQDYDKSVTSVDFLSHDHWLKRRKVSREYVDMSGVDIVTDLVETYTPLTVAPADVSFADEPTGITERFKGVTPAEIIATLTEMSANEQFGATNDLEFFLREFDPNGDTDIAFRPGRYRATEWEDDNRAQINQVRVKYGADGNNEVVVSDKAAQQQLGEAIGVDEGVILEESKTFEGIDGGSQGTARAKAEAILERGDPIAIGWVETFNVGRLRPGQVVPVEDPDAGVDAEFRVAEVGLAATGMDSVLVAENEEGVIDKLANLSEEQDRIEAREGQLDPDASTEFLTQSFDVAVDWTARILQRQYLDRQLLAGGVRVDGMGDARFTPRGGTVGYTFPLRSSETTTVNSTETLTIESGESLETDSVELNGELSLQGELALRDERQVRPTDGGLMGDGFKTQTELVNTA